MKWAVAFPEESILLVRPCLIAICAGNRPAAKLLSVLLYRYSIRQEHKTDAENINEVRASNGEISDQDMTFRIYRKQCQLVIDMCGEITEKTLHDVAVPVLQLFGFLDIDESPAIHCYDVHLDIIVDALEAYKQGPKALEDFLLSHLQLEKFLIDIQLEKFPINKKYFQLALEKVLIANRNSSNNKRGRKPRSEVVGEAQSEEPQINIEIDSKISNKEREGADAPTPAHLKQQVDEKLEEVKTASGKHKAVSSCSQDRLQESDEDISLAETAHRMPAVKATSHQTTSEPVSSQDGAASAAIPLGGAISATSSGPRASGKPFVVPARPTVIAKQRDLMPEPKPLTDKQINDRRAKEIWLLIESKLETTFSASQRKAAKNARGIERLIEDQVPDEKIVLGLDRLTQWEIDNFTVERFHELLPGKTAKHRAGANNNTSPVKQGDQEYGVSGLPKLKPLGSVK